jgi:inorganic pyrophosphatase
VPKDAAFAPLLAALGADGVPGVLPVFVETPKGSRNKFKYLPSLGLFSVSSVLPAGSSFPYDFGFVPYTKAPDGDPIDVLLLMDEPAFTGCLVAARLVGVIEAEQRKKKERARERNDRLVAVASESRTHERLRTLGDLDARLLEEIEHFFVSYTAMAGKEFRILARRGPAQAARLVAQARRAARDETHPLPTGRSA